MQIEGRSILAYFHDRKDAERAREKLESAGYSEIGIDRLTELGGEETDDVANPLTSDFRGLGELTLGAKTGDDDKRILRAAHPAASGMATEEVAEADYAWILAMVTQEEHVEPALRILRAHGGEV